MVAFTGSMNETINAFHNNYESIVVFNSLVKEDLQRVRDLERDFDSLWSSREENITVLEFPKVVKDKLVPYENIIPQIMETTILKKRIHMNYLL